MSYAYTFIDFVQRHRRDGGGELVGELVLEHQLSAILLLVVALREPKPGHLLEARHLSKERQESSEMRAGICLRELEVDLSERLRRPEDGLVVDVNVQLRVRVR